MARKRKPFIAVEFEAIDAIVAAASAAKKSEAELGWGLVRLWRWCWQQRTAEVDRLVIEGWLPGCLPVLVAFGFVRDDGAALVTVRGLDRYITVVLAQADAAHATNAKRLAAQNDPTPSPPKKKREAKPTQPALLDVTPTPSPPRALSEWETWHAVYEVQRKEALEALSVEHTPEAGLAPAYVNASWKRMRGQCTTDEELDTCTGRFLEDPWSTKDPKYAPFGLGALTLSFPKLLATLRAERADP